MAIPNPIAQGTSVASFTSLVIAPKSVVIFCLIPVTPRDDTTYTKPSAVFAIFVILSSEVGAISGIKSMPASLQKGANSSLSSYGQSGTITPEIPHSTHLAMNFSVP